MVDAQTSPEARLLAAVENVQGLVNEEGEFGAESLARAKLLLWRLRGTEREIRLINKRKKGLANRAYAMIRVTIDNLEQKIEASEFNRTEA